MEPWLIGLVMFGALITFLLIGIPVSFALGGIAVGATALFWGAQGFFAVANAAYSQMTTHSLIAIPLFVFLGAVLATSGMAQELYTMMYKWVGHLPGGLAMASIVVCAMLGAMIGSATAGVAITAVIAIPPMLALKYDKRMAVGVVGSAGLLVNLIPPSLGFIIAGLLMDLSIGRLFMAGAMPGVLIAGLSIIYVGIACKRNPKLGPPIPPQEIPSWAERLKVLWAVVLPLILMLSILGSIYTGTASPTEAAAVGVIMSLICSGTKRALNWANLKNAMSMSIRVTAMLGWILFTALSFGRVLGVTGFSSWLTGAVTAGVSSPMVLILIFMAIFFVLGFFLDATAIFIILVPLFVPLALKYGINLELLAVLLMINGMIGYMTPPFGISLFVIRGSMPDISMADIYIGMAPFIIIWIISMILVILFPAIALWLPNTMMQ